MPESPQCPRCGVAVQPDWDWCHACGFDPDGLQPAPIATPLPPPLPPAPPAAVPPPRLTPGAVMASPPGGPSAGPGRVPAWVVVGAAAVLVLGGLGVAALLFTGHKKSDTAVATSSGTGTASTTTSVVGAPSSTSASAPVAGPTDAETQAFGEHYLALVEPSRQAWADYLQADDLASRTPCTCPAGEYDYRPAIPAIEALVTVWQSQLPELDAMASAAPPVVSGDFDTFVAVRRREIAAGRAMANPPPGSAMGAIFTEWVAALTASSDASAAVRADLGLPPPH